MSSGDGLAKNKYIIDVGKSVDFVSINLLLHFYHLTPKHKIKVMLTDIEWEKLMENSINNNLIQTNDVAKGEI